MTEPTEIDLAEVASALSPQPKRIAQLSSVAPLRRSYTVQVLYIRFLKLNVYLSTASSCCSCASAFACLSLDSGASALARTTITVQHSTAQYRWLLAVCSMHTAQSPESEKCAILIRVRSQMLSSNAKPRDRCATVPYSAISLQTRLQARLPPRQFASFVHCLAAVWQTRCCSTWPDWASCVL